MSDTRSARAELEALLRDELWESAELFGGFLVASTSADGDATPPGERAACVALFADALLGKGEHRRALQHYRRALQLNGLASVAAADADASTPDARRGADSPVADPMDAPGYAATPAPPTPGAPATVATPATPGASAPPPPIPSPIAPPPPAGLLDEPLARFKMAKCHVALKEHRAALAELEMVPARRRTLPITCALARAYRRTGYERAAVACYKECLRMNPATLEATIALADLGASPDEIDDASRSERSAVEKSDDPDPARGACASPSSSSLSRIVASALARGHAALRVRDLESAAGAFGALTARFPEETHALRCVGETAVRRGAFDDARAAYERARDADPHAVAGCDRHAELLYEHFPDPVLPTDGSHAAIKTALDRASEDDGGFTGGFGVLSGGFGISSRGASTALSRLARDALESDPTRPEPWVAAALYQVSKGSNVRALDYAQRAIALDDRCVAAHVVRGHVCLRLRKPDASASSFRAARRLAPGALKPLAGLVAGYLLTPGREKEALSAAKEALAMAPNDARAHALLGDVYAKGAAASDASNRGGGGIARASEWTRRATAAYERSLRIEPNDPGVVLALAEHLRTRGGAEGRGEAERVLRAHLEWQGDEGDARARIAARCAMGAVLADSRRLAEALGEYHAALAMDETGEEARRGMLRVERLMKGQDPDAMDEGEEEEEEVVEEEEEEEEEEEGDEGADEEGADEDSFD